MSFPQVHQTFNLVPSLIPQIQDYVSGKAQDPFLQVASTPGEGPDPGGAPVCAAISVSGPSGECDRPLSALPRAVGEVSQRRELPEKAEKYFLPQDFTDLQVLSQIGWFDEYFLEEKDIAELIRKGPELFARRPALGDCARAGTAGAGSAGPCGGGAARD